MVSFCFLTAALLAVAHTCFAVKCPAVDPKALPPCTLCLKCPIPFDKATKTTFHSETADVDRVTLHQNGDGDATIFMRVMDVHVVNVQLTVTKRNANRFRVFSLATSPKYAHSIWLSGNGNNVNGTGCQQDIRFPFERLSVEDTAMYEWGEVPDDACS